MKKTAIALIVVLMTILLIPSGQVEAATQPKLHYHIEIPDLTSGIVNVTMRVSNIDSPTLTVGHIPGFGYYNHIDKLDVKDENHKTLPHRLLGHVYLFDTTGN